MQLWWTTFKSTCKQRKGNSFIEDIGKLGGSCYKWKGHRRKRWAWCILAFRWPICDTLSLTGLLPDKKKMFFPFVGGSKVVVWLPAGNAEQFLRVGICTIDWYIEGICMRPSLSDCPTAFWWGFPLLIFTVGHEFSDHSNQGERFSSDLCG